MSHEAEDRFGAHGGGIILGRLGSSIFASFLYDTTRHKT